MTQAQLNIYQTGDCCGHSGNYTGGVACDESSRVHKIKWDSFDLGGQFNTTAWNSLPLLTFSAVSNHISGPIPSLQNTLNYFYVSKNKLHGTLPLFLHGMAEVGIDNNNLTGTINLPDSLSYIYIMFNLLEGSFNSFPPGAKDLYMNDNLFNGSLPLFPSALEGLGLQNNNFNGLVPSFPFSLGVINLSHNYFTGSIPILPGRLLQLYLGSNHLAGNVPFLPATLFEISMEFNQLNGTFPSVPPNINKLYINNNLFSGSINVESPYILHLENNEFNLINISDISNLIECDISNNLLNLNSYSYLSSKCRIYGTNHINLPVDTQSQEYASTSSSARYPISFSSIVPFETITNIAIPSQQPAPPAGVTTNIWVVIGIAIGALVGVNIVIQTIKVRLAKPIA